MSGVKSLIIGMLGLATAYYLFARFHPVIFMKLYEYKLKNQNGDVT